MTRTQALLAADVIRTRYLVGVLPAKTNEGTALRHLAWMIVEMNNGYMSEAKIMRWLGYIQGVLVAKDIATLDDMKRIIKGASNQ